RRRFDCTNAHCHQTRTLRATCSVLRTPWFAVRTAPTRTPTTQPAPSISLRRRWNNYTGGPGRPKTRSRPCFKHRSTLAAALDSALPSPQGRATAAEAQRPRVQAVAALAARMLGRHDIVDAVLREMPDGGDRDLVQLRV